MRTLNSCIVEKTLNLAPKCEENFGPEVRYLAAEVPPEALVHCSGLEWITFTDSAALDEVRVRDVLEDFIRGYVHKKGDVSEQVLVEGS